MIFRILAFVLLAPFWAFLSAHKQKKQPPRRPPYYF